MRRADPPALPAGTLAALEDSGFGGTVSGVVAREWSKVLGVLTTPTGERHWVKLATHDHGRELLRQEARGYRELGPVLRPHYRLPEFRLLRDADGCTMALASEIAGRRARAWRFPPRPVALLAGVRREAAFGAWARALLEPLPASTGRDRLLACAERLGRAGATLPLGPSHGDFSPWNVFYEGAAPPAILDFEHYAPERPIFFDDCHWLVGTLARRAAKHGLATALIAQAPQLPSVIWRLWLRSRYRDAAFIDPPRLKLTLPLALCGYLLERSATYLGEHAIAERGDVEALIGPKNYELRRRLTRLFAGMLESLGRAPLALT